MMNAFMNIKEQEEAEMQEERTNVVKLKFLRNGEPTGREYTYFTPEEVEIGDLVDVAIQGEGSTSQGIITAVNVPYAEIEPFKNRAKTIVGKAIQKETADKKEMNQKGSKQLLDI